MPTIKIKPKNQLDKKRLAELQGQERKFPKQKQFVVLVNPRQ